jgi:hypothetical protein
MNNKNIKWRLDAGQIEVVDEDVAAVLRKKTPAERIALAAAAHRMARALLAGQIRARHADWTDEQVQREVARRLIGGTK